MEPLWGECNKAMYDTDPQFQELGLEDKVLHSLDFNLNA